MKDKYQKYIGWGVTCLCVIAAALLLAFFLNRFDSVRAGIHTLVNILNPVIYGIVFAFLMAPAYNDLVRRRCHRAVASAACLLFLILIAVLLGLMIVPQFIRSLQTMAAALPVYAQSLVALCDRIFGEGSDVAQAVTDAVEGVNLRVSAWLIEEFLPNLGKYLASLSSGVLSVVVVFKNIVIGLIVMIYLLNIKETLIAQAKKICYSVFRLDIANSIVRECRYTKEVFSKFIVGKLIDSAIIGVLTFAVLSVFRIQYALLISVFIGVTNIIPFFGPFIGAIPSAFLLFMVSPLQCLVFIVIILVIQQLDGNVIGPRIIGQTTGLSSFWVLFSILLFGGLMGITGMIIAVPTFAVIYRLVRGQVNKALARKLLVTDTEEYLRLDHIDETTGEYVKDQTTEREDH